MSRSNSERTFVLAMELRHAPVTDGVSELCNIISFRGEQGTRMQERIYFWYCSGVIGVSASKCW